MNTMDTMENCAMYQCNVQHCIMDTMDNAQCMKCNVQDCAMDKMDTMDNAQL